MILEVINQVLETDYQTEQEVLDTLVQPHFLKQHTNPSRKFLEIYYGIFNNVPTEASFLDGYNAVYLMSDTYGRIHNTDFYTQGMNVQNYMYDNEMHGVDLPKLKADFEQYVALHRPTKSQKERYLTERLEPLCKIPAERKNFIEFRVLNYGSAQVFKQLKEKYGNVKQRYAMDYFENGLTVLLPHTFIYSLICTILNRPIDERECLPEAHLHYLYTQLEAMDNAVFNAHWVNSQSMVKSVETLREFEEDVRALSARCTNRALTREVFESHLAHDSAIAMMLLVAGMRYNSIFILQHVALTLQSIRTNRAKYGMF